MTTTNDIGAIYRVTGETFFYGVEPIEDDGYESIRVSQGDILVVIDVCHIPGSGQNAFQTILLHPTKGLVSIGHGKGKTIESTSWGIYLRRLS